MRQKNNATINEFQVLRKAKIGIKLKNEQICFIIFCKDCIINWFCTVYVISFYINKKEVGKWYTL